MNKDTQLAYLHSSYIYNCQPIESSVNPLPTLRLSAFFILIQQSIRCGG